MAAIVYSSVFGLVPTQGIRSVVGGQWIIVVNQKSIFVLGGGAGQEIKFNNALCVFMGTYACEYASIYLYMRRSLEDKWSKTIEFTP